MVLRLSRNYYKTIHEEYKLISFQKEYLSSMVNNL